MRNTDVPSQFTIPTRNRLTFTIHYTNTIRNRLTFKRLIFRFWPLTFSTLLIHLQPPYPKATSRSRTDRTHRGRSSMHVHAHAYACLCTSYVTLHTSHFTLHTSYFTLHTLYFTLHASHFTLRPSLAAATLQHPGHVPSIEGTGTRRQGSMLMLMPHHSL